MSFRRTNSGISNQHLFYNVDLIVYLEGGDTSYNKTEVYQGSYNKDTNDIIFWQNLFKKFKSALRVKFKSVGSKVTIKEIAVDIINGNINSVMVAMDNEFDEILQQRLNNPNIFYTHGYSWENDIWNSTVIAEVIKELSAIEIDNKEIENNFKAFLKNIKLGVYADGYLFSKGQSFFPRKKGYMCCVDCIPADLPSIKSAILKQMINNKGLKLSTLYSFGRNKNLNPLKFCYGHLLADYCCQVIIHFIKNRLKLPNLNKPIIYRMGLNKFFQSFDDNSEIYKYYELQFNKNGA